MRELVANENPKAPISEIFRTLRTNIQFMNNQKKLQSILITSTLAGEGKSWISANLAVTFAQAGKKVILLDADMRKGRQHKIFNVSVKPGLSNYLSGYTEDETDSNLADYIQETEVENLYIIPAGNIPPNPSELLVSENMNKLLKHLKNICDVIILDGPPTQLVTDSLILTRMVDSTVIVVTSNKTKKDNLNRIIDNIQKVGGKISGIIINKIPISAKKYEQAYYYGSTSMTKTEKRKRNKANNKEYINQENRNRNTQRARDLVEQDRRKKIINTEIEHKEDASNTENIDNLDNTDNLENIETIGNFDETKNIENFTNVPDTNINDEIKEKSEDIQEFQSITKSETTQEQELPKFLQDKQNNVADTTLEKTNNILKQINEYLENEKKNLK